MQSEPLLSTTLAEICKQQGGTIQTGPFGSQLHASDYAATGTPVVMPADIVGGRVSTAAIARVGSDHVERLSQHQLRFNDIIFSRRGDVTRFARVTEREVGWLCGTGCLKVRIGTGTIALPEWVAIALGAPEVKDWLVRHAIGATMPNLNTSILGAVPLKVPPIERQREAVEVCSALDDRIDLLRQTSATLESIAQALFKSWFIDFDPVRAKAEGREPEGVDAATAALFPAGFEESALGLIPSGWNLARLGDLIELAYGKALKATDRRPGSVPVYGSGGVTGYHDEALVKHPSIVVGRKGSVGTLYWEDAPFFPIDTTFYVKPKNAPLTFCFYAMQRLRLENMNTDAAVPGLNRDNAYRLDLVRPERPALEAFDDLATPLRKTIRANALRADALAQIRDTLLPRLISGKLRLPETQREIEEALA